MRQKEIMTIKFMEKVSDYQYNILRIYRKILYEEVDIQNSKNDFYITILKRR